MRWIIIFLFASFWPAVYSQTWIGTYNISSTCDTATCCCITNQVLITPSSQNYFGFNISLAGTCYGLTSYSANVADPNSYTVTTSISIITLTIQLSSDSSTLTISNSYSASCDAVAVREAAIVQTTIVQTASVQTTPVQTASVQTTIVHSNAVPQYVNIIILCSLVFFGIVMSF
jgi:hypothetical protein